MKWEKEVVEGTFVKNWYTLYTAIVPIISSNVQGYNCIKAHVMRMRHERWCMLRNNFGLILKFDSYAPNVQKATLSVEGNLSEQNIPLEIKSEEDSLYVYFPEHGDYPRFEYYQKNYEGRLLSITLDNNGYVTFEAPLWEGEDLD